jgi:DNA-binding beta-propeller fold protein YncE
LALFIGTPPASAKVDLTPFRQTNIGARPLDVAASPDGKLVFVLIPEELLVYSIPDNTVTNRIPLAGGFDRVAYSPTAKLIILTSSTAGTLKAIKVETVFPIDISGHPFKGPADAPVTIALFDDYQ